MVVILKFVHKSHIRVLTILVFGHFSSLFLLRFSKWPKKWFIIIIIIIIIKELVGESFGFVNDVISGLHLAKTPDSCIK